MSQPIRIATVIKSQALYQKIKKIFPPPRFDVARNISHREEAKDFVLSDEAHIAIIDDMVPWGKIALSLFQEYKIEAVLFNGDFDQIENLIAERFPEQPETKPEKEERAEEVPRTKPPLPQATHRPPVDEQPNPPSSAAPPAAVQKPSIQEEDDRNEEIERLKRQLHEMQRTLEDKDTNHRSKEQKLLEEIGKLQNQPKPEPELIEIEGPERYRAINQQFIIVGGMYRGVGSSFLAMALAKIFDSMNVETLLMEFPKNEPYLYFRLGGAMRMPRNYAFYYPQMLTNQKLPNLLGQREEWKEGNITWMPADPSTGPLNEWTNDHMRKSVYRAKQTITILDVGTAWLDPALEDVLAQAHHVLLVCGPDQAKLASRKGREIRDKLIEEQLELHIVANFVPDPILPKTKEWFESLPYPPIVRFPNIPHADTTRAMWDGVTIFDQDDVMLKKAQSYFLPIIKQIVPPNLIVSNGGESGGFFSKFFKRRGE